MRAMIQKRFLLGCCLLVNVFSSLCSAVEREDWRLELLAAEKLPHDTASLEARCAGLVKTPEQLERAVIQLGAASQGERQKAQSEILLMGREVLPQLRALPESKEPEVRMRVTEIQRQLEVGGRWNKDELLRLADTGLLHERQNKGAHASKRMFVEQFRKPTVSLGTGYRDLRFIRTESLNGRVGNGQLIFSGDRDDEEGDQRLVLDAKTATGKAEFPKRLRIDVKLGGKEGGEGQYHVGVAVGNVRALYHPGYATGAFRLERVNDNKFIVANQDMGFTPSVKNLQSLFMEVEVLADGKVKFDVTVRCEKEVYRTSWNVAASEVGKFDSISLDRSGRQGGDAVFDDWIVEWDP